MPISRYHGQPLPIVVKFPKNPLTPYGKTYGNIEDISMNLKVNLATDADDLYLEKLQSLAEVTLDTAKHQFTMLITEDDYTNLVANTSYFLTLNVKVSGISDYLELPLDDRTIRILPDTNRA